jgi:putative intracellular protease/amidase
MERSAGAHMTRDPLSQGFQERRHIANNPDRVIGRRATGFSRQEDSEAEKLYGKDFIPNFPQPIMEKAGINLVHVEPWGLRVVVDGKLITGQNQQSASEYAIAFNHALAGESPVLGA